MITALEQRSRASHACGAVECYNLSILQVNMALDQQSGKPLDRGPARATMETFVSPMNLQSMAKAMCCEQR